jgi:small subunit ribosomal protein S6
MTTDVRIDKSRATDYETIFILRADIDSDASERAISRAVGAIEQGGGKLLKLESWGKRRLAFPIGKQRKGFYVYVRYLGYRGLIAELERNLRMLDTVLRYMTTRLRADVDPASIAVDPEEVKVRRIEITDAEDDREDSVEASLGLADEQRSERRERRERDEYPEGYGPEDLMPQAAASNPVEAPAATATTAAREVGEAPGGQSGTGGNEGAPQA